MQLVPFQVWFVSWENEFVGRSEFGAGQSLICVALPTPAHPRAAHPQLPAYRKIGVNLASKFDELRLGTNKAHEMYTHQP
jgi:hypothetical protein